MAGRDGAEVPPPGVANGLVCGGRVEPGRVGALLPGLNPIDESEPAAGKVGNRAGGEFEVSGLGVGLLGGLLAKRPVPGGGVVGLNSGVVGRAGGDVPGLAANPDPLFEGGLLPLLPVDPRIGGMSELADCERRLLPASVSGFGRAGGTAGRIAESVPDFAGGSELPPLNWVCEEGGLLLPEDAS